MELKEMILSTLAELEENGVKEPFQDAAQNEVESKVVLVEEKTVVEVHEEVTLEETAPKEESCSEAQRQFYVNLRERVLVLFEGFQSPNNKNIEAKIDLTLNFLEYLLATIDEELERTDRLKR